MAQRTAIITGATGGLGLACAAALLASDPAWHVVLAVRDGQRGAETIAKLGAPERCTVVPLDLASLASVRAFPDAFAAQGLPRLAALVCNAGVQDASDVPQFTVDGFERTFAVNHLGHVALIAALRPHFAAPARIVMVASDTHDPKVRTGMPHPAFTTADQLARPLDRERVPGRQRYTTSKLCNVLFAYELDRHLGHGAQGITVNAFNPGLMPGTGLVREAGPVARFAWRAIMPAMLALPMVHRPRTSGRRLAALAGDPAYEGQTGRYFDGAKPIASSVESRDTAKARQLWDDSERLIASVGSPGAAR
jgi:NAD(P)-dependent dehydrogenase (short-subunit alcohol dehydrogenase family)